MSKGYLPQINPRILRWCREEAGFDLDLAAHKIGITAFDLTSCEAGTKFLTIAKLRSAARIYNRPPALFYFQDVPESLKMPVFRRLPENEDEPISPELRLEVRRIYEKRGYAMELSSYGADFEWNFIGSLNLHQDPEEVGMVLRNILGVSKEYPIKKIDSYKSFNFWRHTVESRGILVFQATSVPIHEMRGLSIAEKPYPVIAVNRKDPPEARAFSLLHEFCHIMLGKSTMCEVRFRNDSHNDEVFCNHVAGAALVPREKLLSMIKEKIGEPKEEWNEKELHTLSSFFGVSREVILRRLLILNLTSSIYYGYKRSEWKKEREDRKPKGFGERGHERILRKEGSTYTKLILNAFENKAITKSELSKMLGMKLRHLPQLEQLVFDKR